MVCCLLFVVCGLWFVVCGLWVVFWQPSFGAQSVLHDDGLYLTCGLGIGFWGLVFWIYGLGFDVLGSKFGVWA